MSTDSLSRRLEMYVLSAVVGVLTGTVGAGFHWALELAGDWTRQLALISEDWPIPGWLVAMLIGAGMVWLAVALVKRYAPQAAGSGIQEVEGVLADQRTLRPGRVIPVKFVSGWLGITAGLTLGREGPTIHMGSALGQIIGRWRCLSTANCKSLIAAGAGAGLAAAFNAPIAGIIFVTEEMRRQFEYTFVSLHCVIVAAYLAVVVNDAWWGHGATLVLAAGEVHGPLLVQQPLLVLLGLLLGAFGALFNTAILGAFDLFRRLEAKHWSAVALAAGALVEGLKWFYPASVGGGYKLIETIVGNHPGVVGLLVLLAVRTLSSVGSYAVGTPGGIFAPMLALGTLLGLALGTVIEMLFPEVPATLNVALAVAAMGGVFAATVRAPVTAIVLVIELTQNYELVLPVMLSCLSASITAQALGSRPIYTSLLERTLESDGGRQA